MANTITNQEKSKLLDQMLEDIAGEEFSDYDDDFTLDADLERFSETDHFVEIDNYH